MKILNFGSLNIDYVYQLDHFLRPGETLHSQSLSIFCGGKGLNQSIALARAGAEVYHAGCVGITDGQMLLDALSDSGVNTDYINTVEKRSGNAIIQVNRSGENCIILFGGANDCVSPLQVDETIAKFQCNDYLLLQNEISCIGLLIEKASEKGMIVAFNPSPCNDRISSLPLHLVDIFFVNEIEGMEIAGINNPMPDRIISTLREKFPIAKIVLTLGKRGVIYFDGVDVHSHDIYDVPVVDTTAAGDTFTGYFLASLIKGKSSPLSIEIASKASSIAVSRAGASISIPTMDEVMSFKM